MNYNELKTNLLVNVISRGSTHMSGSDHIVWENGWVSEMDKFVGYPGFFLIKDFNVEGVTLEAPPAQKEAANPALKAFLKDIEQYSFPWQVLQVSGKAFFACPESDQDILAVPVHEGLNAKLCDLLP